MHIIIECFNVASTFFLQDQIFLAQLNSSEIVSAVFLLRSVANLIYKRFAWQVCIEQTFIEVHDNLGSLRFFQLMFYLLFDFYLLMFFMFVLYRKRCDAQLGLCSKFNRFFLCFQIDVFKICFKNVKGQSELSGLRVDTSSFV